MAHYILDIELEHTLPKDAEQNYAMLDWIIDSAEDEIDQISTRGKSDEQEAIETLKVIASVLEAYGFEYEGKQLLSFSLRSKRINCDGYSALYMAIGEALELPIKMVRAPAHTFVRWQFGDDEYLNWETTRGVQKSDHYYIATMDIKDETVGIGALRSLDVDDDREEILANAYVNSGVAWLRRCMPHLAKARFLEAIHRDPTYDTPYYNIGLIHYRTGELAEAIMWCEQALERNPNHIKSHAILKEAFSNIKDHRSAQGHFAKVIELDPEYYERASFKKKHRASVCRERPFILSLLDKL